MPSTGWAWGSGAYGDGNPNGYSKVPVRVGTGSNWRKISGRSSAVLGLRTDGSLWSWGQSSYGMLGLGSVTSQPIAARVGQEATWADVAVGQRHVVASRTDGSLWGWGHNTSQEYGLNGVSSSNVPLEITSAFVPAPEFQVLRNGRTQLSTLAGPTCDSLDIISRGEELPELEIGDIVYVENIGAYSTATATTFNGLPSARIVMAP